MYGKNNPGSFANLNARHGAYVFAKAGNTNYYASNPLTSREESLYIASAIILAVAFAVSVVFVWLLFLLSEIVQDAARLDDIDDAKKITSDDEESTYMTATDESYSGLVASSDESYTSGVTSGATSGYSDAASGYSDDATRDSTYDDGSSSSPSSSS